jgi:ankyrin repeat protein
LIDAGAKVDERNINGNTALLIATKNNNLEISKLLIDKGAKVDEKNKFDDTPLLWATRNNNTEIIELIESIEKKNGVVVFNPMHKVK